MKDATPLGWSVYGKRGSNLAYIEDTNLAMIHLTTEGGKVCVRLLSEFPEPDQRLRGFRVTQKKLFSTYEEAWKYARKLMLSRNAENRVRRRYT